MKQTIFETRQRAEELLKKALEIWRKSDQSDFLEGIENDPVFSLLMTALAYQANETENEIAQMKTELLEEFAHSLTPFEMGHAVPATAVVETALQENVPEMQLNPQHIFMLGDTGAEFIPLLNSRILNSSIRSIVRMDGRRWKVSLSFKSPVSDLSGFTFAIRNHNYRDLRVTLKGQPLPLVKPWDYSELPLSPCFALDAMLYNKSQTYMASSLCMDLYARQNVRMYCVKPHRAEQFIPMETENLDLVFEFMGINDAFQFDRNNLSLNSVILVNARLQHINLSSNNPIVRVAGYGLPSGEKAEVSQQFLHLLRPSDEQLYGSVPIEVRRMAGDRFNQGSLIMLLNRLIAKYYADYYAFMSLGDAASDRVIHGLAEILANMSDAARRNDAGKFTGVYLMLRASGDFRKQQVGVDIEYVTTQGAAVNEQLNLDSQFVPPSGFDASATRQIAPPVPGFDELRDERAEASMTRYYLATNDRLVTPADIKLFCYHELLTRYGIIRDMVKSLSVSHRQQFDSHQIGYEILVEIVLTENAFILRGIADRTESIAMLIQSMISVRSTNIFPVHVTMRIEPDSEKK